MDTSGVEQKKPSGTFYQGISRQYQFKLKSDSKDLYVLVDSKPSVTQQTKVPVEGRAGGVALALNGADLVADSGTTHAVSAAAGASGIASFGAVSGGHSRYNTGSHVDVDGFSLMAGVAHRFAISGGLTAGAFLEGGWGSYSTYNHFSS